MILLAVNRGRYRSRWVLVVPGCRAGRRRPCALRARALAPAARVPAPQTRSRRPQAKHHPPHPHPTHKPHVFQSNLVKMFTLRKLRAQLPNDDATRHILVSNVPSPMSDDDVKALMPDATRWAFTSSVVRTDFVASFPSRAEARRAYANAQGLSYLDSKLIFEYVEIDHEPECDVQPGLRTKSEPPLYFSLPTEAQHAERAANATKIAERTPVIGPPSVPWVNQKV